MEKINKTKHAWVWEVAKQQKYWVKTLSDLKAFFNDYEYSVSDDADIIEVAYSGGWVQTHEGEYIHELLDGVRLPPVGESFAVQVYHDCPGCCRAKHLMALMFVRV
jgi:hypothetical protein